MTLTKIISELIAFIQGTHDKQKRYEATQKLLQKLKLKEQNLLVSINSESDQNIRNKISRNLNIVRAQLEKGKRLMEGF